MFARCLFACSLLLAACDTAAAPEVDAGTDSGPPGYDGGLITRIPESEAAANRASCTYARGAMPWQTIGEEHPIGDDIPIDHIFVVVQENRSFDHYFGMMPGVEGIQGGATNPDADGTPVSTFHASDYCIEDVEHGWRDTHAQYNDGAVDGFVTTNDPNGGRAMGYLDESDLPFYWDLARTFAMSDHHHSSVLGPTWPNRYYMLSGTSFGLARNEPTTTEILPGEGEYVLMQQLDRAGVSWGIYYQAVPFVWGGYPQYALRPRQRAHTKIFRELWTDLDAGTLPSVVFLDPSWSATHSVDANDEHAPANPQRGQAYVREIVTRIMASDVWPRSAIIVTYDEHGGFFDHVAPPEACHPGDRSAETSVGGDFDRLGFRVPLTVVSPYARPGYVSDRVTDAASVLRFVQTRFLLPAMTGRDANAWPLLDMFDFETPTFLDPPDLADAPVDEAQVAACRAELDG